MAIRITLGEETLVTREGVREPQLLRLASGDLVLMYHVQADTHFAKRQGLRSSDGGHTWSPEPRRAHREQAIGQGTDGLVLATDIYTFERKPGEYAGSFFRSTDGGQAFTGPHALRVRVNRVAARPYPADPTQYPPDDHVLRAFYQPVPDYYTPTLAESKLRWGPIFWRDLVEHQGRWLAPMQVHYHGDRFYRTILVASEDKGETWDYVSEIAEFRDQTSLPGDGFCEPALIALADGSLLCVLRRGGALPLGQTRSLDGGRTWSVPELLPGHGVDPGLLLMSNGILACTYGRPGLHLMFSPDGRGEAWGYRTVIGEWPSSCYMGIAEVAPGELLLIYDRCEAAGQGRIPDKCWIGSRRIWVERD